MMLDTQDITFAYPRSAPILNSVSLQIRRGTITVITGNTGSGKSTLAKCLTGLIPRTIPGEFSGKISIDDKDIADLSLPEISRKVALVQQDTDSQICTLTVVDEVAFGPENFQTESTEIEKIVDSSLEQLDCTYLKNRSTTQLSGGERQRLVISSVLACQPDYLILDEPTSSLDPSSVAALRKTLIDLKARGLGIVIFEHRLHTVLSIADQVFQLQNGTLTINESPTTASFESRTDMPLISENELLTASGISFSYDVVQAVNDIDLSINGGDLIALMGDNGSGKTTLLALLGGLLTPNYGEIRLESKKMAELSSKDMARKIAIVFQNPTHQIFERTVWREQLLASEVLDLDDTNFVHISEDFLERAQLEKMKEHNPFSLSHGQKRRLNVTSTVAHSPLLHLFDEPFIGQDEDGRHFITEVLVERAKTAGACVVATHDSHFAKNHCNRLLFMEKGRILFDGSPSQVLERLNETGRSEYYEGGIVS